MLKMETQASEQLMTVPYALNKTFREIFKTAQFRRGANVFVAKATTQNRAKWAKFEVIAQTATEALARLDEVEMTMEELEKAAQQVEADLIEIERQIIDKTERIGEARERRLRASEQIEGCKNSLAQTAAELEKILGETQQAEKERDAVIAPAIALFEFHDLEKVLGKYTRGAKNGYLGKELRREAQQEIHALLKDLQRLGYSHDGIWSLYQQSLNRPDSILRAVDAVQRNMRSGIYSAE